MKGWAWLLAVVALVAGTSASAAETSAACRFQLGFATLHDALSATVGDCLDNEAYASNGDGLQHTTGGLLVWRKADNRAAFTDGSHTWVNGPNGIQERLNSERFPFEHDQLGQPDLRFRLLDTFGPLLYCDPDFYPIARADELSLALARFPQILGASLTYQAILAHEHFDPATLSDTQKLTVYRDYKELNALQLQPQPGGMFAFNAQFGVDRQSGIRVQGTIDGSGSIQVIDKQPAPFLNCPICLTRGTPIGTPAGDVPVEDVHPGMVVWTLDRQGRRKAVPVLQTGSVDVPDTHQVVDVRLSDGRRVRASPGHPIVDGRRLGQLRVGDALDGALVVEVGLERYTGGATFDLLPGGETGFYLAGGVPLASTLKSG